MALMGASDEEAAALVALAEDVLADDGDPSEAKAACSLAAAEDEAPWVDETCALAEAEPSLWAAWVEPL